MDRAQTEYDIIETELSMKKATGWERQQLASKLISLNNSLMQATLEPTSAPAPADKQRLQELNASLKDPSKPAKQKQESVKELIHLLRRG